MIKMNHELTKQQIEEIRENYPPGTRIELIHMDDQYAVPAGTHGSVNYVDDAGQIHIREYHICGRNECYGHEDGVKGRYGYLSDR